MSAFVWKGLPKVLRILGKRYKLLIVERVDEDDSYGEHFFDQQTLKAKEDQGFETARDTVLHEAIHGVEEQLNLNLKEQQVRQLATGVIALMRDNPSFVRWLMAKEPKEESK